MRGKLARRCLLWIALWACDCRQAKCGLRRNRCRRLWITSRRARLAPGTSGRPAGRRIRSNRRCRLLRDRCPGRPRAGLPVGGTDAQMPHGLPINLATAMQLAGVRPLDIEAATVQVRQALAVQLQAKALLIPTLNAGVDYFRHDGVQQNIFLGPNFRKGRQSFFVGGGPSLFVGLTDAIFNPLAARRVVDARRADVQTARNDVLFNVSQAFFELQSARGRLLGVGASIARAEMLVNFTKALAPSLIAPLEINRAKAELESLRQTQQLAIRDWRVTSARLAEILLLEPDTLLEPVEPPFLQVTLVSCDQSAKELVPVAVNNRPEISSRRELVAAAERALAPRAEAPVPARIWSSPARPRPPACWPAGNLSSGPNGQLNSNGSAIRVDVAAVWQLQNGGIGNIGRIRAAAGRSRPGIDRVHADGLSGQGRGHAGRGQVADRPGTRRGDGRGTAPGDRIGRQELHRSARDGAAGRRAAAVDHPPPGSRCRHHRARDRVRTVRAGRE